MSPVLALAMVLELSFWPGKNAARDRRVVALRPHPCGEVAVARVSTLPKPGTRGPLEPEEAIELSNAGRIIQRWAMPVDACVFR
ncbi:MAG: hypothetical protein IT162_10615 [Bryobacterales bacterium]|nr:hypothetical protein [Bryobacterales bacterium]